MANYNYQPAEVNDFSGGMTDIYVNAPTTQAEVMENFFILENRSLKTRPGTVLDSLVDAQIPVGAQRIHTLISYNNSEKLFAQTVNKLYYRNPVTWSSLLGPTGNNPFKSADTNTHFAHTEWNRHLIITNDKFDKPAKVYRDENGNYQMRTAGLPRLASAPTITPTAGTKNYLYAFHFAYTYMIDDQEFVDYGPVTQVEVSAANTPISITNIPVLANGSDDNYDTANIKVFIFRTIDGGKAYFKVGEVTNGTTSFNDTVSDTILQDNEPIYTTGNVPENDPPPLAKFCHSVNGKTYYAHYKEGTQVFPSKIRQSQSFDPDSVPGSFEDELEDEITGLSSIQDIPVVGCRKHIYRIEGAFDEVGREGMSHVRISDHAGCLSHESFVQAEGFLFWFGNDGVYVTEGYKVQKVSSHLTNRFKQYAATLRDKTRKIKGTYDEATRTIHWTFSRGTKAVGAEDCDIIWSVDLNYGISDKMPMHIWAGGESFLPTSVVVHAGKLHRGDRNGFVLVFNEDSLTDPKIVPDEPPSTWGQESIIWRYRSVASNFGTSFVRKIANKILITSKNETNVSIAVRAINDDGKLSRDLMPIRWRKNFTWGDDEFIWGDPDFAWYYGGMIEVDRRFPAKGLRFNYLQVEITNDFTNVINSNLLGTASVDAGLKTCTLTDVVNGDWPLAAVDYYIYFENDQYTKGFKVLSRGPDTLVLEDLNNELVSGTYKWQLKGYKKGEILNLTGYSISWALLTRTHDMYNKGDNGGIDAV